MSHAVKVRQHRHISSLAECLVSGDGSGMPWDALASRPALVVPESTWLQGGAQRDRRQPKTTKDNLRIVQNGEKLASS